MKLHEWNAALSWSRPWQLAYPDVFQEVKIFLDMHPDTFTSATLAEALYPVEWTKSNPNNLMIRKRLFQALMAGAKNQLRRYRFNGAVNGKGHTPHMWRAPQGAEVHTKCDCPFCMGEEIT